MTCVTTYIGTDQYFVGCSLGSKIHREKYNAGRPRSSQLAEPFLFPRLIEEDYNVELSMIPPSVQEWNDREL